MHLKQFAESAQAALPLSALAADSEFAREVQGQLQVAGLLDGPIDGRFGPVSEWALTAFCERAGVELNSGFSREVANRLIAVSTGSPMFALDLSAGDLATRVVSAMRRIGYWIAMHPECLNIVYIEGCDIDGTPNGNAPNRFNDARLLISIGPDGKPQLVGAWEATTEPGRYWTLHPKNPLGAARIAFGQHKVWALGAHNASKPSGHEALVQVEKVTVHRDFNKDYQRAGDETRTGMYGINQHWGYDNPKDDLGKSSAGCLVGRTRAGHKQFMSLIKEDPRYVANHAYRFVSTVMSVTALTE